MYLENQITNKDIHTFSQNGVYVMEQKKRVNEAQKADMERQLESAAQEQAEFEKLESWADLYDNCTFEAKKMIVSQLIKAVYVYRDYRLEVEFRVSFDDFRRLCVGCEPNGGRIATVESV